MPILFGTSRGYFDAISRLTGYADSISGLISQKTCAYENTLRMIHSSALSSRRVGVGFPGATGTISAVLR
ncbi:hypothetical protein TorRG33x02_151260 [Trema orientale]|uniref:Uncharacterized protein n=1 Tax=Trema orientale TaxID=63057 RepID=A0A2P5EU27_TREOI|nr:hypothetical protein TorRG33x02_151260 [Trema orientale]